MECVALDVERLHLGIADFDALFVGRGVERALDFQACACRKSNPNILVMQPAQDWKAKNTPRPLNRAR
jgi:hypothetical protein